MNEKPMELIQHFDMPPFTRIAWVSEDAKRFWEPVLDSARNFYDVMEYLSVVEGVRHLMTTHIRPEEYDEKVEEYNSKGLVFAPIIKVGDYDGFAHAHPPVEEGKPWSYYGPLGRPDFVNEFVKADELGDHVRMGQLLGFPTCCTSFFHKEWGKGYHDPVWQVAMNSPKENIIFEEERFVRMKAFPEALSLLRYIGPRFTFHIPCSTTCEASKKIADDWVAVAKKHGYHEEVEALQEVSSWPIEWSALHGIAEVKTPVFKFSTNSVPTREKYVVQIEGSKYPEFSAQGLDFPYLQNPRTPLTKSKIFELAEKDIQVD